MISNQSLAPILAILVVVSAAANVAAEMDTNMIRRLNHTPPQTARLQADSPASPVAETNTLEQFEQIRSACIEGRRMVCGRVVQMDSHGLVVDSGYTNLMRPELKGAWLVRSHVAASRPGHLVEGNTPDSICAGLVFVADIPRKPAVNLYDFVALEVYPAGHYVYAPVPNVKKTIRRFSAGLSTAVKWNLDAANK